MFSREVQYGLQACFDGRNPAPEEVLPGHRDDSIPALCEVLSVLLDYGVGYGRDISKRLLVLVAHDITVKMIIHRGLAVFSC